MDEEGLMDIDDLKLQLQFYQTTGRPMLGSFSACSIATGICSVLCLACFTSLELSHALISQQAVVDGYDAITLSPHKFLGRPGSPGILLMNKALYQLKNSLPSTCGTVNYVNYYDEKDTLYINDIEEREHAGTPQIIQRVKAALAFLLKEYVRYKIIAEKEHKYIGRALETLLKNTKRAGNATWEKLAKASGLRASADQIRGTNHEAFLGYVREAAGLFESIRKFESAASCYCDLGEFERADSTHLLTNGSICKERLVECFTLSGCYSEAVEAYAKGDQFANCLSVCRKGKLIDKGLEYIKYWKERVNVGSIEVIQFEQGFLENGALEYHESKVVRLALITFYSLEEESGNFLEVAELVRGKRVAKRATVDLVDENEEEESLFDVWCRWTREEEILLTQCWIETSENGQIGADRSEDSFWGQIMDDFNTSSVAPLKKIGQRSGMVAMLGCYFRAQNTSHRKRPQKEMCV
ncbi:pyridoxal phosphate-dependent transferase [Tanacetum coccineum]